MIRRKRDQPLMSPNRIVGSQGISFVTKQVGSAFDTVAATPSLMGLAASDLIIVVITMTGYERVWGPITSTGMTFYPISVSPSNAQLPTVYYGFAPDSTSRTISVTTTAGITAIGIIAAAYRGVHPARPLDVLGVSPSVQYATTTTPSVPSLTTTVSRAWAFSAIGTNGSTTLSCTQAGWTNEHQFDNLNGQMSFGLARNEIINPGATGAISWSQNPTRTGSYTSWALNPLS